MKTPKQQANSPRSSESGFTIIESLVAIVVTSILLAAIAPVIVLSVATRVQARRVELATQAAKSYIDGVRTGAIAPPSTTVELNAIAVSSTPDKYLLDTVNPPTATSQLAGCLNGRGVYAVSTACDGNSLMAIQAFRSTSSTTSDPNRGYRLGLRVYRVDAFGTNGNAVVTLKKGTKQATFTGGFGDRTAPLIELTTEVNSSQPAFLDFCNRLGGCR